MTDMDVVPAGDGKSVVITVAADTPAGGALRIPIDALQSLIGHLQAAAATCSSQRVQGDAATADGGPADGAPGSDPEPTISISDTTECAGFAVLTLLLGQTHVSVGIPNECLSRVGTTFLAMSADRSMPQ